MTLDYAKSALFCIDEGLNSDKGSLSSFKTNKDGSLKKLNKVSTLSGPVSGVLYGKGNGGLAIAH